jgi:hypothetical protein
MDAGTVPKDCRMSLCASTVAVARQAESVRSLLSQNALSTVRAIHERARKCGKTKRQSEAAASLHTESAGGAEFPFPRLLEPLSG